MFYNFAVKNHGDMKIALAMTMKRCLHGCMVCLVMGIAFAACSPSVKVPEHVEGPSLELSAIDSQMWRQPDSALAQLQALCNSPEADSLDEFNGHYCQVLISELLYKNDCEQTNREDLLQAVDFFDSLIVNKNDANKREVVTQKQNVFLDARAHYINGVGYYELGNVVHACAEYLKALEVMEEHFEEKELVGKKAQFMTYIYNRLGDMFEEQLLAEPAIACYKQALPLLVINKHCFIADESRHLNMEYLFCYIVWEYNMTLLTKKIVLLSIMMKHWQICLILTISIIGILW